MARRRSFFLPLVALAATVGGCWADIGSELDPLAAGASGGDPGASTSLDGRGEGGDAPIYVPSDECPTDYQFFVNEVWNHVLASGCATCHNPGGLANDSELVLSLERDDDALRHNFEVTAAIALAATGGTSDLLLKPTGRHPEGHGGGRRLSLGSNGYALLEEFWGRVSGHEAPCAVDPELVCEVPWPGTRRVRRLTRAEYASTVRDLTGVDDVGVVFTADSVVNGYDNDADALTASPLLVEQWLEAAERVADALVSRPDGPASCPSGQHETCARDFIEAFGARAFRRPLDDTDRARYLDLYRGVGPVDGHAEGVRDVVIGMLISPHFLYRMELGEAAGDGLTYVLTPHEVAAELSYLFWGSMPDDELLRAADEGELSSPEGVAEQARRLLADRRSDAAMSRFFNQWLGTDPIRVVPRDGVLYAGFDDGVRAAMAADLERFVGAVLRDGEGTLDELLTRAAPITDGELAAFVGDDADAERVGLLGRPAVLAVHALPQSSSPIHRGKLVRERFLCQELAPPPPGLAAEVPPLDPELTTRERFTRHASDDVCAGCHRLMDPIGFGLEAFDGVGRIRSSVSGRAIDDAGAIVDSPASDGTFEGLGELASLLAESADVEQCFVEQWLQFGYGQEPGPALGCFEEDLLETFVASGGSIEALVVGLTQTPRFLTRAADGVTPAQWVEAFAPDSGGDIANPGADMGADLGATDLGAPDASGEVGDSGVDADLGRDVAADLSSPASELQTTVTRVSEWPTGYCAEVRVTSSARRSIDWAVIVPVEGALADYWNAEPDRDSGDVLFEGVAWNNLIEPGAEVGFGFCAAR